MAHCAAHATPGPAERLHPRTCGPSEPSTRLAAAHGHAAACAPPRLDRLPDRLPREGRLRRGPRAGPDQQEAAQPGRRGPGGVEVSAGRARGLSLPGVPHLAGGRGPCPVQQRRALAGRRLGPCRPPQQRRRLVVIPVAAGPRHLLGDVGHGPPRRPRVCSRDPRRHHVTPGERPPDFGGVHVTADGGGEGSRAGLSGSCGPGAQRGVADWTGLCSIRGLEAEAPSVAPVC